MSNAIASAVAELKRERVALDQAITTLEGLMSLPIVTNGARPAAKKHFSASARQAMRLAQQRRWAAWRKRNGKKA